MRKYKKVAVGGTFDELHKGHKILLSKSFEVGDRVIIGLSSDLFVSKMGKPHETASYKDRSKELEAYLRESGFNKRSEIVPLNDPFGLTISNEGFEALIVSKETCKTAEKINEKREKACLPLLKIIAVDMVPAENDIPISTTRIRRGEIDHNGRLLESIR